MEQSSFNLARVTNLGATDFSLPFLKGDRLGLKLPKEEFNLSNHFVNIASVKDLSPSRNG